MLVFAFVSAVFSVVAYFLIGVVVKFVGKLPELYTIAPRTKQSVILGSASKLGSVSAMPVAHAMLGDSSLSQPAPVTRNEFSSSRFNQTKRLKSVETERSLQPFDLKTIDYSIYDSPAYIRKAKAALAAQKEAVQKAKRKRNPKGRRCAAATA